MAQKSIQGNVELAKQIKQRRNELGLTIEEAAARAGVGTKTWSRYEAGESIRRDKSKGICKALNWQYLSGEEQGEHIGIDHYRKHEAWSKFLEDMFGPRAAMSFAVGSDILWDQITEDMEELASMPRGSQIGQLDMSWLKEDLPAQFLMCYDYDFLYRMKCILSNMRMRARAGASMAAHSVLQELILYLCVERAAAWVELSEEIESSDTKEEMRDSEDWVFDLFGDEDIITFLYSDFYLDEDDAYHYFHWDDLQFYMDPEETGAIHGRPD